jgi:hypothetical protein
MKNLIEPQIIEAFKKNPPSYEKIHSFLVNRPEISASLFCKMIDVNIKGYYDWNFRRKNKEIQTQSSGSSDNLLVKPATGKNKYTAADKLKLINEYSKLEEGKKAEFLRKFGLYQSDISKWNELSQAAAIEALSKRKTRNDKKSEKEIENDKLKKEITSHEKTIAKLAALVMLQKKVSEILFDPDQS